MDIIIFPPTIDWTFMKQRPQQLMTKFAQKGYCVFYCNKTQKEQDMELLSPNLYLVHHHQQWVTEILPLFRQTGKSRVGVWCSWPMLADILDVYQADWVIYDCVDDFAIALQYEKAMINKADAITCTADRIKDRLVKMYPQKTITLIPNAYDDSMGLHLKSSKGTKENNIIGYIGAWAPWVDEALIRKLAYALPTIQIILIGIEFDKKFRLHDIPNITYLGHLPHDQLALHLSTFSVCLIPFKVNSITLATNPVKMYEYLATGKPVVSTNLPECRKYEEVISIASSHLEFIAKVKNYLKTPGDETLRRHIALSNTWEHRCNSILSLIDNIPN
ncbi:glycosyltransferase family protein [Bacillus sp. CHD6a]|uniref:glycosyltransferase family protein n=1 Tax=Bacillus sp. CHD6a TaxID=1643452 RepID=UPI000760CDD4|nr:glycosyltransferase [Bacillus sp. CHD6a]